MRVDRDAPSAASALAEIPAPAASWKATLLRRVERNVDPDPVWRLIGPNES